MTYIEKLAKVAGAIKDSGERRQFETGAVRDIQEGKGRCDLMPLRVVGLSMRDDILTALSEFMDTGDTKHLYGCLAWFSRNWDDGKTKHSRDAVFDQRMSSMFLEVAKHFEEGAKKYGENNWQKGLPANCYIDSAVRHYLKWLRGDKDEPHDRAFVWNLMCCIWEVDFSPRAKGENVVEETIADIHDEKYSSDESTTKRSETVHYICDRRACEECTNPDCNHTSDIQHAANFEKIGDAYFEKEKPEESVMDIHVESAWIRLGNCPCGLVEIDGIVYVKTAALISKTNDIAVVNVTNGVMTALHPDIYARPLEAIKSEDYNRAWNQKGDTNE